MDLDLKRLRKGELIALAGAVLLLMLMLALRWDGSRTGWQALTVLRWLMVPTIAAAFILGFVQVTRGAPAIPVTMSLVVLVLALPTAVWLAVEVIIIPQAHQHIGAVLGLLSACTLLYGGFLSLRREGIAPGDERTDIPTVATGRKVPS